MSLLLPITWPGYAQPGSCFSTVATKDVRGAAAGNRAAGRACEGFNEARGSRAWRPATPGLVELRVKLS
ncbi:MAG: hypothetical protein QOE51_4832 [Actinoplanes sp.]|jgi:hypothetical protein|nr:hypothetical protein [Actinoplanes sp.]